MKTMQTTDEMRVLYNGFLNKPRTHKTTDDRQELAEKKLLAVLDDKQQELLFDYLFVYNETWADECENAYQGGFQTAVRLFCNALQEK